MEIHKYEVWSKVSWKLSSAEPDEINGRLRRIYVLIEKFRVGKYVVA